MQEEVKVKLADGKERTIQHMMCTTFWHPDGTPMSAQQFMEMLFGKLPEFFKNEAELRALWSAPDTRKKLLQGLAEKGFGNEQLAEMQKIIDAEKSDLFDVLAYVAYALPPLTREERAAKAKVDHQHALQQQAAGLSRFRAVTLCERRRGGTRSGETDARCSCSSITTPLPTRSPTWADPRRSARCSRDSRSIFIRKRHDLVPVFSRTSARWPGRVHQAHLVPAIN